MINEGILVDTLPSDIVNTIISDKTVLGNNPAIPDIYDIPFLVKITENHFNEVTNDLKSLKRLDDIKSTTLENALNELIFKCVEIERPFRDKLEKLCFNFVNELFSIPDDLIVTDIEIVDKIESNKNTAPLEPIDTDSIELEDLNTALFIKKSIHKRHLLNALCMGGGINLCEICLNVFENEINNIDPNLMDLYKKILLINDYLLLITNDCNLTDKNKKQIGTVSVVLGDDIKKTIITARSIIFPILVIETIRGFLELFISHGLPKNKQIAKTVISKSDYIKIEPWNMRLGLPLWKLLMSSLNDISSKELPFLIKRLSSLQTNKFNYLMKEVFAKTKKSKLLMSNLSKLAKNDMEYNRFIEKIPKMNTDKTIIADNYIQAEEL
jgi:hypothetical protein